MDCIDALGGAIVTKKEFLVFGLAAFALISGSLYADADVTQLDANVAATQKAAAKEGWQGSVSLGYLATTHQYPQPQRPGPGGLQIRPVAGPAVLASPQSSENGVTTAENCDLNGQSDYSFSDTDYVFGMADYLRDTLIAATGGALPKSWVTAADC